MQAALDPFGDHPFTTEQTRLVRLLVERVDVHEDALEVRIRAAGLMSLLGELRQQDQRRGSMMSSVETRLDGSTLIVRIPMRFRRRSGRKRIVAPDGSEIVPTHRAPAGCFRRITSSLS